ncbi:MULTISPECIES: GNAT family N-acetyltransferase [unclassified Breznakia]|uniref:GNAT family N-acetyltransferase n=1 Tax=unclassified Breznakia TaxID=2623764 RepID=UPI00247590D3|nr:MULTISPECIES: GNAT family N-acetyltransferase [unclassified Breznakia]MDH6365938.1 putative GNAT family N-acyltransferase [Breznakia sp. PH1-1]MDH6403130.1 putative GNAT family N-acyltransferase [Breznakia sp. PF1-11]MDH6410839.1 putative GNAT family N-acyltransferase [Breznakia sp. PFB1-11]MDH6413104.1 putative GNAT family N-acyltransferase [Breznakia sp. PFB1-14]MDH6415472.1 putative GNAT family N-acyltransferase [Breznakia sp. PFB1-4]
MKFEIAIIQDLVELTELLENAKVEMETHHIYQWNQKYPNRNSIVNDIENEELYILKNDENQIVCMGTFTKNAIQGIQTKAVNDAIFIKRLIVKRDACGKGLSRELIDSFIKEKNIHDVDLYSCTNHTNIPMQKVLEKMNFVNIEAFTIKERTTYGPFYLYYMKAGEQIDK